MDFWDILFARQHGYAPSGDYWDTLLGRQLGDGGVWETENAPYLFRQSGGALNSRLLNKEKDCLVGASVGWNSLVKNGNFADTSNWTAFYGATFTASGNVATIVGDGNASGSRIFQDVARTANHKYIWLVDIKTDGTANANISLDNASGYLSETVSATTNWKSCAHIFNSGTSSSANFRMHIKLENNVAGTIYARNVYLIDLTLMLGSAIADYAYTLESGTAGAGIAWLKSYGFFTEDYYGYNAGSLESVNATAHIMRDGNDNIIGNYPLADLDLRGVFKMDADHNIYAEGDIYESSGKVTRNTILRAYQSGDESLTDAITDGTNTIVLSPNASTEQATPFTSPQSVDKNGTEQYIDGKVASGTRDVAVPVGHETEYKCEATP